MSLVTPTTDAGGLLLPREPGELKQIQFETSGHGELRAMAPHDQANPTRWGPPHREHEVTMFL